MQLGIDTRGTVLAAGFAVLLAGFVAEQFF
jgi:hypothetical protein